METEAEKTKTCPCKCGKCAAAIFVAFIIVGVACWYIHHPNRPRAIDPNPGTTCIVRFRDNEFHLTGKFRAANREAILLEADHASGAPTVECYWIPKSHIQYITICK